MRLFSNCRISSALPLSRLEGDDFLEHDAGHFPPYLVVDRDVATKIDRLAFRDIRAQQGPRLLDRNLQRLRKTIEFAAFAIMRPAGAVVQVEKNLIGIPPPYELTRASR